MDQLTHGAIRDIRVSGTNCVAEPVVQVHCTVMDCMHVVGGMEMLMPSSHEMDWTMIGSASP